MQNGKTRKFKLRSTIPSIVPHRILNRSIPKSDRENIGIVVFVLSELLINDEINSNLSQFLVMGCTQK